MPKLEQPASGTKAKPKNPNKGGKGQKKTEPKLLYPNVFTEIYDGKSHPPMTREKAREIMGYTTDENEAKERGCPFPVGEDLDGKKVYMINNTGNRPLTQSWSETLAQEILNSGPKVPEDERPWQFNGEAMIIGQYGMTLSAQHRLFGFELACQMWEGPDAAHWKKKWPTMPTLPCLLVYGVRETQAVKRTLDNVKPRTLADVLFTSDYLKNVNQPSERKVLCRIVDHAVRLLWHRTGAGLDAFSPRRTHAEALNFIERHPRIIRAAKHIWEEDQKRGISKYIGAGYAAALLYLMGASDTDGEAYRAMQYPSEKKINWDRWDIASEFWTLLKEKGDESMAAVRDKFSAMEDPDTLSGGTLAEKIAVLAKAWNAYKDVGEVTSSDVILEYYTDKDNIDHLDETPDVGGIDLGEPAPVNDETPSQAAEAEERRKEELEQQKKEKLQSGRKKPKAPKKAEEEEGEWVPQPPTVSDEEE